MKLSEESASTSIYLEQIDNHINLSEGYSSVRQLLFKELNLLDGTNPSVDDRLAESIVEKLAESLTTTVNFHQSQKTFRALQVITDLLTYAEEVMTPVMHNQRFVTSLNSVALPKIVTFNSSLDTQCRTIALGIIAFWYDKYAREENCTYDLFIQAFKYLKDKKLAIPEKITIKPVDTYKSKKQQKKNQTGASQNTIVIILQEIEQFTVKTQKLLKQNIKNIATTEYVRLIKHKSKVLFDFTQKGGDLNEKQKGTVKDCYKRLRTILKEVDKYNQNKVETKVSMNQEQEYIEQKMTPKKSQKLIEPLSNEKKSSKKQEYRKQSTADLLGDSLQAEKVEIESQKKKPNNKQFDLLDLGVATKTKQYTPEVTVAKTHKSVDFVDLLGQHTPQKTKAQLPQQSQDEQQQFVEGVLVDINYSKSLEKEKSDRQLQEVFSTPSKKQVSLEEETDALAKQASNQSQNSNPDFNNEKKKDKYSELKEIDLSHHSSDSQRQTPQKNQGLRFNLFGIFGNKQNKIEGQGAIYDQNRPYDYVPEGLQKKTISSPETIPQTQLMTQQLPSLINPMQFKPVKAVDYSKYAHHLSPQSDKDIDEDHVFEPNKPFHDLEQVQVEPPRKASKKGDLLGEDDD